jgi:hypothetical protein
LISSAICKDLLPNSYDRSFCVANKASVSWGSSIVFWVKYVASDAEASAIDASCATGF